MDHENRAIVIQNEDNLKQPICASRAPDEILVIGASHRVGGSSLRNHQFRLVGLDTMFRDMLDVPIIPAKLHQRSSSQKP
jgi:hypothetical protein